MNLSSTRSFLATAAICLATAGVAHSATITGLADDRDVRKMSGTITLGTSVNATPVSMGIRTENRAYIAVFQLPELNWAGGERFASADFGLRAKKTGTPPNGDLYGLDFRVEPDVLTSDHFGGELDVDATLIQDSFLLTSSFTNANNVSRTTDGSGNAALSAYLNAQYAASLTQRIEGDSIYVFLRVNADSAATGGTFRYFEIDTADHAQEFYRPKLTYETQVIPEPAVGGLALMAVGMIGLRRRRQG